VLNYHKMTATVQVSFSIVLKSYPMPGLLSRLREEKSIVFELENRVGCTFKPIYISENK